MSAYYNEIEPSKAAWLRGLIKAGHIAPGEVDERSIAEVEPKDLAGFTQCHFFAGIGVWSYALRLAGWPDSRPVWTGSCPCPSFSAAGKGSGLDDPRHLWPTWFGLIRECLPATLFGEQVDGAIGYGWLDLVQTDMEGEAYAVGKAVLGACSVGSPHIRRRLYFVADTESECLDRIARSGGHSRSASEQERRQPGRDSDAGDRGDPTKLRCEPMREIAGTAEEIASGSGDRRPERWSASESKGAGSARDRGNPGAKGLQEQPSERRVLCVTMGSPERESINRAGATRGFWAGCDWWYGRDGKWRPIESGLFPLAHGAAARVGRLRGYGDAIVPQVAEAFIRSFMEV